MNDEKRLMVWNVLTNLANEEILQVSQTLEPLAVSLEISIDELTEMVDDQIYYRRIFER